MLTHKKIRSGARGAAPTLAVCAALLATSVCAAQNEGETPRRPGGADTVIPFPHPVITEVLYRVPPDPVGDANGDGIRDPQADEFVELYNPHDRPIDLTGYTLTDAQAHQGDTVNGLKFTFPRFRLEPKGVIVVFNLRRAELLPPVGTEKGEPGAKNPRFNFSYVFQMTVPRQTISFADNGDFVLLRAPDGAPIDAVTWGRTPELPPDETLRLTSVFFGASTSSAQRVLGVGEMHPHAMIDNYFFSPGRVPLKLPRQIDPRLPEEEVERLLGHRKR